MSKKVLFLDFLCFDSSIQVGSHKYIHLFKKNGYEVFSLTNFLNINRFFRRHDEDKELIAAWKAGIKESKEGVLSYTPFCLVPYLNLPVLDRLSLANNCLRFCYPGLRKILAEKNFLDVDVLFINNIRLISVLKFVRAQKSILRISDRIEGFANMPRTILDLQKQVIKSTDHVVATSKNLHEYVAAHNPDSHYLPNGVDEDFILKAGEVPERPEEYKNLTKPIVLYVGAISDWFDYDLYEYGVSHLQEFNFVIIGPISGVQSRNHILRIEKLAKTYGNFRYLGPRRHAELKKYLFHAKVGTIPFKISPLTNDINPIKLFEYCAYGLPTTASNMSELDHYSDHVFIYKDQEGYIKLLQDCVRNKNDLKPQLIDFARDNTWEKRFAYMLGILNGREGKDESLIS